jgi:glyoxylase-like metal-dependent hydrolase (beta-lactamase superfamily II)
VLFGKPYVWIRDRDGVLMLCGDATFANAPQRYVLGPPSFDDLMGELGRIEREANRR